MIINISKIKQLLFDDEKTKQRIEKDYGFTSSATDIESFAKTLITSLDQKVKDIDRNISNKDLFEAAVKSLGSNSRSWATFISKEPTLRKILFNYEPRLVYKNKVELQETLRDFFPGQSRTNDVNAVLNWAEKLSSIEDYYSKYIRVIINAFRNIHSDLYHTPLKDEHLFITVAGFFANPPTRWKWENYIEGIDLQKEHQNLKFNGMGYPLTSEFLRNLGWNGFKPDRHIKRLFDYWNLSDEINLESEMYSLLELSGRKNKELYDYIKYSLIGLKITPADLSFSEVDNFIWASGAYVLKKGKENLLTKEEAFVETIGS